MRGLRSRRERSFGRRRFCGDFPQQAPHRLAAHLHPLHLGQLLGQVAVVEAHVLLGGQLYDPCPHRLRQPPRLLAPAIPVPHPRHRVGPVSALEPLHLPLAQRQQLACLGNADPAPHCVLNHLQSLQFVLAQLDHLSGSPG